MSTPKKILFLCPHGAAKSLWAMVYCNALAEKAGINIDARNAGTEPDATLNARVVADLKDAGYAVADFAPQLLTDADLAAADYVVSLGCISGEQVPAGTTYLDWADVPLPSQDFEGSRDLIYAKVKALIASLQ